MGSDVSEKENWTEVNTEKVKNESVIIKVSLCNAFGYDAAK